MKTEITGYTKDLTDLMVELEDVIAKHTSKKTIHFSTVVGILNIISQSITYDLILKHK